MPNYNNSSIYKICSRQLSIKEIYVGSTINLKNRTNLHKRSCNSETCNYPVYKFIRENGGWDNWQVIEVARVEAKDKTDLRRIEREWMEKLNATLNDRKPLETVNERFNNQIKYRAKYHINNLEKVNEIKRKWTETVGKKKVNCDCGGRYTISHKKRHMRSKKHQSYLEDH